MATEREEVRVDPHPLHAEHGLPDGGHRALGLVTRRDEVQLRHLQRGGPGQEGLHIQLAHRGERQCLELHVQRGHHVRGEDLTEVAAEGLGGALGGVRPCRNDVGHQASAAQAILGREHHGLTDGRVGAQVHLDVPQLDARPAHLDLLVAASEELELTVHTPPGDVARAVEPCAGRGAEGIRNEAFRRPVWPVDVAAPHPDAANEQLTGDPDGGQSQLAIQDVHGAARAGPADGHLGLLRRGRGRDVVDRRDVGALGGPVGVLQGDVREARQPPPAELDGQRVAAHHHPPQGERGRRALCAVARPGRVQQRVEERRDHVDERDAPVDQGAIQTLGLTRLVVGEEVHLPAHEQRGEELPGRGVEDVGSVLRDPVRGAQADLLHEGLAVVAQAPALHQAALGNARRSGGEDDVGQAGGRRAHTRVVRARLGAGQGLDEVQRHRGSHRGQGAPRVLGERLRAQHGPGGALLHHSGESARGLPRIEDQVGPARLEDTQQGHQEGDLARGQDGGHALRREPRGPQGVGHLVGARVQLLVRERLLAALDRQRRGRTLHLGLEGADEVGHRLGRGRVPGRLDEPRLPLRQPLQP